VGDAKGGLHFGAGSLERLDMNVSRRAFLMTSTAGLIGGAVAGADAPGALVGSQLYGWGQYYQREGKQMGEHLGEVLSALRDAGYDYAEGNLGGADANEKFATQLKEKGMKPVSLYSGGAFHDAATAEARAKDLVAKAKSAKEAGFGTINCNPDSIGRDKSDEELATQAKWLGVIGAELAKNGVKLGIHNHTPEMRNGAKEFHNNLRATDAAAVGFCYDVHWVFRGGVMPAETLAAYGQRIVSWHLRQSREKIWWEDMDSGDVDYPAIAAVAKEQALAPFYTVELAIEGGTKITRTAVQNHARSREYVKKVWGI
jgi:inosose dehydratase